MSFTVLRVLLVATLLSPIGFSVASAKSWDKPPEMKIDLKKNYSAVVSTNKGSFTIELFAKDAPKTVNNFVFLAKQGFFKDIIFHRIIREFMIQTGDPKGNGSGDAGYKFEDELQTPHKYGPGTVAMANSGPNTNGSQFFICTGMSSLNLNSMPNYTIFGKVKDGMNIVEKIAGTPVKDNGMGEVSTPKDKVFITGVKITEK